MNKAVRWLVGLLSVLTFASAQHDMAGMSMDGPSLASLEGEAFEIAFISGMIAHHEGATEMARWILERTDLPGVAGDAQQVIAAQEPEINLMQGWLDEWNAGKSDPAAASMMANEMGEMKGAMTTYDDPNVAFLSEMSAHHNSAIDMAQLALTKAVHPKLRELAKEIVRNQAQEIADYQETLAALTGR